MGRSLLLRKAVLLCLGLTLVGGVWHLEMTRENERFQAYYQAQVAPLMDAAAKREEQAVALAVGRLHEHFNTFRRGAPNFSRDLSTWSTRFAIAGHSIGDLWTKIWHDSSRAVGVR